MGRIYMDNNHLTLITDKGKFSFAVSKEACPHTFFCDFYGANHLFGSKIVEIRPIPITYHNRTYRKVIPKHRSVIKNVGQHMIHNFGEDFPEIHGYEIITRNGLGVLKKGIFSFQGVSDTPVPPKLVETSEHIDDERYRILKPQFRITPQH